MQNISVVLPDAMVFQMGPLEEAYSRHRALYPHAHRPGPWAVGCSGGVDSVALLHVAAVQARLEGRSIAAFYVHHGQHDQASAQESCVKGYAQRLEIPFFSAHLALPPGSSEHKLRGARLVAFETLWARWLGERHDIDSARVLLAHHQDDQAETALLRLIRGMSPRSPALIQPVSRVGGLTLLRPLLNVPKTAIIAYAAAHALTWVEDPTNTDLAHARNAIRSQVLPLLERLRPGSAARIADFFTELQEAHEEAADKVRLSPEQTELGNFRIEEISFNFLKARVEESLGEGRGRVTRSHWNALMKTLSSGTTDGSRKAVQFPGGLEVIIHRKRVSIITGRPTQ